MFTKSFLVEEVKSTRFNLRVFEITQQGRRSLSNHRAALSSAKRSSKSPPKQPTVPSRTGFNPERQMYRQKGEFQREHNKGNQQNWRQDNRRDNRQRQGGGRQERNYREVKVREDGRGEREGRERNQKDGRIARADGRERKQRRDDRVENKRQPRRNRNKKQFQLLRQSRQEREEQEALRGRQARQGRLDRSDKQMRELKDSRIGQQGWIQISQEQDVLVEERPPEIVDDRLYRENIRDGPKPARRDGGAKQPWRPRQPRQPRQPRRPPRQNYQVQPEGYNRKHNRKERNLAKRLHQFKEFEQQCKALNQALQKLQQQQQDNVQLARKEQRRQRQRQRDRGTRQEGKVYRQVQHNKKKQCRQYSKEPQKQKDVKIGKIYVNLQTVRGTVIVMEGGQRKAYSAQGKTNINRALNGSTVYIQPFSTKKGGDQCRVIGVKENPFLTSQLIGLVVGTRLKPLLTSLPQFTISNPEGASPAQIYSAKFERWEVDSELPICFLVKPIGELGDLEAETCALLLANGVLTDDFPQECYDQLNKFIACAGPNGEFRIPKDEIQKRLDLRGQNVITIDPETARDFDDALSIRVLEDGNYQVGVHIADVSHFVKEKSLVDAQATKRTTSVYLVHKVYPMLPRVLCQQLCSLNPKVDRLTMSFICTITPEGQIIEYAFKNSVINSCARLSYQAAQEIIEGKVTRDQDIQLQYRPEGQSSKVVDIVNRLNGLSLKLKGQRMQKGAIVIEQVKKKFKIDQNLLPVQFKPEIRFQANFLVEQFMLLANIKAAEFIVAKVGPAAVLRRHPFPGNKKCTYFQKVLALSGESAKLGRGLNMQQLIDKVLQREDVQPKAKTLLRNQTIFFMEQAKYFHMLETEPEDCGHFALMCDFYTHFTSPIRRYPDIMVHRQIKSALLEVPVSEPGPDDLALMQACNEKKTLARRVSDGSQRIFFARFIKQRPIQTDCYYSHFQSNRMRVSIPQYGVRETIDFGTKPNVKGITISKSKTDQMCILSIKVKNEGRVQFAEFGWGRARLSASASGWGLQLQLWTGQSWL